MCAASSGVTSLRASPLCRASSWSTFRHVAGSWCRTSFGRGEPGDDVLWRPHILVVHFEHVRDPFLTFDPRIDGSRDVPYTAPSGFVAVLMMLTRLFLVPLVPGILVVMWTSHALAALTVGAVISPLVTAFTIGIAGHHVVCGARSLMLATLDAGATAGAAAVHYCWLGRATVSAYGMRGVQVLRRHRWLRWAWLLAACSHTVAWVAWLLAWAVAPPLGLVAALADATRSWARRSACSPVAHTMTVPCEA